MTTTKTNAKKVLTERDVLTGIPTQKEMTAQHERELRKIATETGAPRARSIPAKLANGVSARTAPNSAKAVADGASKVKAAKVDTSAPRAYTKGAAKNTAREGTWRHYMLETTLAHKATDKAQAACDASKGEFRGRKLDFRWMAAQGYIVWK